MRYLRITSTLPVGVKQITTNDYDIRVGIVSEDEVNDHAWREALWKLQELEELKRDMTPRGDMTDSTVPPPAREDDKGGFYGDGGELGAGYEGGSD